MPIVVWVAAIMVAASIPLGFWSLSGDRPTAHRASQNLVGQNPTMRQTVLQRSLGERLVLPLTRQVGSRLVRFTPIGWVERRNRTLARAGLSGRVSAEQILGAKLVLPASLVVLFGLRFSGGAQPRMVVLAVACVVAAFCAPDLLARARADRA